MIYSGYNIRLIREEDDASILRIVHNAFEELDAPRTGSVYDDPRTEHLSLEFLRKDAEYWVIEKDGKVLGGCGFYPTEGLPEGMAEIVKFYFSPALRGMGMGRKTLEYVAQRAKEKGYKKLYIESFPQFSNAVRLYERFGFRHIAHAIGNSGHPAVTIYMEKDI